MEQLIDMIKGFSLSRHHLDCPLALILLIVVCSGSETMVVRLLYEPIDSAANGAAYGAFAFSEKNTFWKLITGSQWIQFDPGSAINGRNSAGFLSSHWFLTILRKKVI